jgi:hypothetical protein
MFVPLRAVGSALYEPEAGGSIIKKNDKTKERSDIHKFSIFNLHSSIERRAQ